MSPVAMPSEFRKAFGELGFSRIQRDLNFTHVFLREASHRFVVSLGHLLINRSLLRAVVFKLSAFRAFHYNAV